MANRPTPGGLSEPEGSKAPRARIIVVSDSVADGSRTDQGGPAVADRLVAAGFVVDRVRVTRDGRREVADMLREVAVGFAGLVVTTGGTGFGPRDLTPEGTADAVERQAPGLAEAMRGAHPAGRLSRAIAGTIGEALILNVPGSPTGAVEYLDAVLDVVPHALDLLAGRTGHH